MIWFDFCNLICKYHTNKMQLWNTLHSILVNVILVCITEYLPTIPCFLVVHIVVFMLFSTHPRSFSYFPIHGVFCSHRGTNIYANVHTCTHIELSQHMELIPQFILIPLWRKSACSVRNSLRSPAPGGKLVGSSLSTHRDEHTDTDAQTQTHRHRKRE